MVAIIEKKRFRDFDWLLALLAVGIVFFGTWQIYNAQPTESYWKKQLIGLAISLVLMVVVSFTDYRKLVNFAPAFYLFGLFLLVIVLIPGIGMKINGQRCWIKTPLVGQFQPSEFVKIPTVLMLAFYFGRVRQRALAWGRIAVGVGILAIVITALALSTVTIPAAYVVGVKTGKIKNYQQQRIQVILDPENADRKGFGYHTWQSIVTVGKGGLTGTGVGTTDEYSQSRLKFLPEPHSDFIFAVTAETTGFVGCVLLLLAYAVLLSRLLGGARRAPDRAGMLVIMAIVGGLAFQIFINVGMALGILPVIGVPLPLMSAGLSSVLATFIAIGFAVSVQLRRFVN
jgi:rod shape determining protein RodA